MLLLATATQLAEIGFWGGLYFHLKRKAQQRILIHGNRPQPTRIPILDTQLKRIAGHPDRVNRIVAERAIRMVRRLANTRAFEYLVLGLFNKKSKLHPKTKKHRRVQIS